MKEYRDPRHGPNTAIVIAIVRIVPIQVRLVIVTVPVEVRHPAHKLVVISHVQCMTQSQPSHGARGTRDFVCDTHAGESVLVKWIETRLSAALTSQKANAVFFDLTCSGSPPQGGLLFAVQEKDRV